MIRNLATPQWQRLFSGSFCVNIIAAAKPGVNHLAVKVSNVWPNRLIGDKQLSPDCEWNGDQLEARPQWLLDLHAVASIG